MTWSIAAAVPPMCNVAEERKDEAENALMSLVEATPGTENTWEV